MMLRRLTAVTGLLVTALLLSVIPASATSYRYWSFWDGSGGSWSYQSSGPNTYRPADGSVDGWRFGVGMGTSASDVAGPRAAPAFATACAHTPAVSGKKRVAVVIDYGTATSAPSAAPVTACATLDPDATSAQLLAQLDPPLRYDSSGTLCAISGYPKTGCADVVSSDSSTSATTPSAAPAGPVKPAQTTGWFLGAALVVLLAGAAYWQTRRRRE